MNHNRFMKVVRLGTPHTEGLLQSGKLMYFEKIDGSNGSFRNEGGVLVASSHNRVLDTSSQGDNAGFCKFILDKIPVNLIPEGLEFFGEWLVPHHVRYNEESYKQFYMYDILHIETGFYLDENAIKEWADTFALSYLEPVYVGNFQGLEHLKSMAEQTSALGENQMEGIVVKNYSFVNRYGNQNHGKYVNEGFCESKGDKPMRINTEMYDCEHAICERFINIPRLRKMIEKGVDLGFTNTGDMRMMGFVPKLMIEDILLEESYTICTEYNKVDFKQLKKLVPKYTAKTLQNSFEETLDYTESK